MGREQLGCAGCKETPQAPDGAFVGKELLWSWMNRWGDRPPNYRQVLLACGTSPCPKVVGVPVAVLAPWKVWNMVPFQEVLPGKNVNGRMCFLLASFWHSWPDLSGS